MKKYKQTNKQTEPKPKLFAFLPEQPFLNKWVDMRTRQNCERGWERNLDWTQSKWIKWFILHKVSHPQTFFLVAWKTWCARGSSQWNLLYYSNRQQKTPKAIQICQQNNKESLNGVCTHTYGRCNQLSVSYARAPYSFFLSHVATIWARK